MLELWMAASTDSLGQRRELLVNYPKLAAAVYKKTMEVIGEDKTLKVCTCF